MIKRNYKKIRERFVDVLHLDDPPNKIALGLALGVFIAFTPFYGLHTVLTLIFAPLLRANFAAALAGAMVTLPPVCFLVYPASFLFGLWVMGRPLTQGAEIETSFAWMVSIFEDGRLLTDIGIPLLVGCSIVGLLVAVVTYSIAIKAVNRIRAESAAEK